MYLSSRNPPLKHSLLTLNIYVLQKRIENLKNHLEEIRHTIEDMADRIQKESVLGSEPEETLEPWQTVKAKVARLTILYL
jgi:dynactin complex subunit